MYTFASSVFALFTFLSFATAKVVVVTVGGNTTANPGAVFNPPTATAKNGDVVYFNFTEGNHTVTQSVFAAPCMRAHDFNQTINGFDSGVRDAGNHQAITNLQVPITDDSTTIWYFDWNTCSVGGVGGINVNESSLETYDGFVRNAMRLNGTEAESTTASGASGTATASSTASRSTTTSSASRAVALGTMRVIPLMLIAFALLF